MQPEPRAPAVEWRVVYAQRQIGQIAAGTYTHPCGSNEEKVRVVLGHYRKINHVTEAWIERREIGPWERTDA